MASHVPDRRAFLHRVWAVFAIMALSTSAAPVSAARPASTVERVVAAGRGMAGFEPTLDRYEGAPGEHVTVMFPDDGIDIRIVGCKAGFASLTPCPEAPARHTVDLVVPSIPPQETTVAWEVTPPTGPTVLRMLDSGSIPFRVLEPVFDVTLNAAEGFPNEPVIVTFTSRAAGVSIKDCRAWIEANPSECEVSGGTGTAEVVAPEAIGDTRLLWTLRYAYDMETTGATKGALPFRVIPRPSESPPPPPVFRVVVDPDTAGPGQPVTVRFSSETPGVTVESCAAGFGVRNRCDESNSVVALTPADARVGTTIELGWELTYVSERPGESPGSQSGRIEFPVTIDKPVFAVTVEPGAAAPGQPVLVSIQSLVPGIDIVECLVFFPNDAGSECQRSPDRWFARTRVPPDAAAGMTQLRWGVAARTTRGDPHAANGVIDYEVLARHGPSSQSVPSKIDTTTPSGPGSPPVPGNELGSVPEFIVVTEPESARPGGSVLVTVSSAEPGVEITACLVAFAGQKGSECRRSGAGWAATVTVPDDARPGDLQLRWGVGSRTTATARAGAANGLIDYRVLGDEPAPPAFSIRPDPAGAPPGQRVAVMQTSLVNDVAITDCSAGFDPNAMSPCRQSAQGWLADVVVPQTMHAGPSTVRWRLTYARDQGGSGVTDGLVTFTVLAAPPSGGGARWWSYLWRPLLGAVLLAGLVGYRRVTRYFRDRRHPIEQADEEDLAPVRVRVSAQQRLDRMEVAVSNPDARPVWQVRITTHEPDLDPVISEEAP